ncbi:MAG: hypothetical protein AAF465_13850 [Pseudomonadota bacterium]
MFRNAIAIFIFVFVWMVQAEPCSAAPMSAFVSDYYSDAFEAVSSKIDFVPYRGALRDAEGTARDERGNSVDQSLLLAAAIRDSVHAVRFVEGGLNKEAIAQLLGHSHSSPFDYSAAGQVSTSRNRYDPVNDRQMQRVVRQHVWLEVQLEENGDWIALDPSFPNAQPGQSFGTVSKTHETLPSQLQQKLKFTLYRQTASGARQRVGGVRGTVSELTGHPISIVLRGIPQYEPRQEGDQEIDRGLLDSKPGGLLGGGFGMGGSNDTAQEKDQAASIQNNSVDRQLIGVEYRGEFSVKGEKPDSLKATTVAIEEASNRIVREWLEIELRVPGQRTRKIQRDLFVSANEKDRPADIRRYSIAVIAGLMNQSEFELQRARLQPQVVSHAKSELNAIGTIENVNERASKLIELEAVHAFTPYLLNLAFAMESDAMTHRLARGAGVRVIHSTPRILISSVETGVDSDADITTDITLDLRLDEVVALPYEGMPKGVASLFQRARGMQESHLEGSVLERFVADPSKVITTTRLMDAAQRQGKQLLVLTQKSKEVLSELMLPKIVLQRLEATLEEGYQVIIPSSAVQLFGSAHWGWWSVDQTTGAFVGVMESGQHQAMGQYSLTLEKIGVNDAMGFVIGALTGSTATMTLYSAKMIEYGQVTEQLIAEVAAGIERLTCVTCPSFEVVVSPVAASASIGSQCFEESGYSIGTGAGVSGSISFCEKYKLGISCAASLMLGTFEVEGNVGVGPNVNLDLGPLSCD